MKRQRGIFLIAASMVCVLAVMGTGCGDDKVSAAEEEKMKKQMTDKFDINNVPPEQRERVRAFMNMGRSGPSSGAGAPGAAPAPGAAAPAAGAPAGNAKAP